MQPAVIDRKTDHRVVNASTVDGGDGRPVSTRDPHAQDLNRTEPVNLKP